MLRRKIPSTNKMLVFLLNSIVNSAFVESNPSALISELCATKSRSPACEIVAKCPSSSLLCDSKNAYSLLYQMCLSDFKSNPDCSDVASYCTSNPALCATKDISTIPTAANATAAIFSICYEMPQMAACSTCPPPDVNTKISDCPLLQTYADHCTEMPDMSQCPGYTSFCSAVGKDLSFCTGDTGSNSGSSGSAPSIPTEFCGPSDSFCVIGSRGKTPKSTCFTIHSKSTGWFGLGLGSQMLGKNWDLIVRC
jgi:hypothetical protein